MKIHYISNYSIEEAVDKYCDEKAWKLGNPKHRHHSIPVVAYLSAKMDPFILACNPTDHSAARDAYLLKMRQIQQITRPETAATKEELESKIGKKLRGCFSDLILAKVAKDGEFILCEWNNAQGEIEVDAKYKVTKTASLPACVEIESLRADRYVKKGRATNFLQAIVSVLQEDTDPYAHIRLYAWTGYNSYYGRANGAYTWSRLGFELKEFTKQEKDNLAFSHSYSAIGSWKESLMSQFRGDFCFEYFFNRQIRYDLLLDPNFPQHVKNEIKKCQNTWDVAALTIENVPIGRYLMSTQDGARYTGVLYPSCPNSPGMIQYNKRLRELAAILSQ